MGPPNIFLLVKSQRFVEKRNLSCFVDSAFCIKRVSFMSLKVSILKKKGSFFFIEKSVKRGLF